MSQLKFPQGFFRMEPHSAWGGDYERIAVHGWVEGMAKGKLPLSLFRTGPFVPEVTVPNGAIIVTERAKGILAGVFPMLQFRLVVKKRIVRSDWPGLIIKGKPWPDELLEGEPESQILGSEHSDAVAKEMPPLWQLILEVGADVEVIEKDKYEFDLRLKRRTWTGTDLFNVCVRGGSMVPLVTGQAKTAIEELSGQWLEFAEVATC